MTYEVTLNRDLSQMNNRALFDKNIYVELAKLHGRETQVPVFLTKSSLVSLSLAFHSDIR